MLASGQQEQGEFRRGVGTARGPLGRPRPASDRPGPGARPGPQTEEPPAERRGRPDARQRLLQVVDRLRDDAAYGSSCRARASRRQARRRGLRPQRMAERRLVAVIPAPRDRSRGRGSDVALDDPRMTRPARAAQGQHRQGRRLEPRVRPRHPGPADQHRVMAHDVVGVVRRGICSPFCRSSHSIARGPRPRDPLPPARAARPAAWSSPAPAASARRRSIRRAAGPSPASRNTPR